MLTLASPAKVNLFLRIIRKREDGYHELASLFQAIDLCDKLHFQLADTDKLTCSDSTLPTDHTNLVSKAMQLFRRKTGVNVPLSIHLEKNIPQQAGLGGGSSNAATTLWAYNQLVGSPAKETELAEWAAEIGSDISFFLSGGTAYCTGRGEIMRSIAPLEPTNLWIVKPSMGLSTPQVYGRVNTAAFPKRDPKEMLANFLNGQPEYFNDLEEPAFSVLPELENLKQNLVQAGFSTVLMSGSGSSFFCIGHAQPPMLAGLTCYSARFINRSDGSWYS